MSVKPAREPLALLRRQPNAAIGLRRYPDPARAEAAALLHMEKASWRDVGDPPVVLREGHLPGAPHLESPVQVA